MVKETEQKQRSNRKMPDQVIAAVRSSEVIPLRDHGTEGDNSAIDTVE